MPLMPVSLNSGLPVVSGAAFAVHDGELAVAMDALAHPFWDQVLDTVSEKAIGMCRRGCFGAAMRSVSELEQTGIMKKRKELGARFVVWGYCSASIR
jgi:fructose 1,6-bisphosphatase